MLLSGFVARRVGFPSAGLPPLATPLTAECHFWVVVRISGYSSSRNASTRNAPVAVVVNGQVASAPTIQPTQSTFTTFSGRVQMFREPHCSAGQGVGGRASAVGLRLMRRAPRHQRDPTLRAGVLRAGARLAVVFLAAAFRTAVFFAAVFLVAVFLADAFFVVALTGVGTGARPFTTFLKVMPGVNRTLLEAATFTDSPVWGLRPLRAFRWVGLKAPNPVIATLRPAFTSLITA